MHSELKDTDKGLSKKHELLLDKKGFVTYLDLMIMWIGFSG